MRSFIKNAKELSGLTIENVFDDNFGEGLILILSSEKAAYISGTNYDYPDLYIDESPELPIDKMFEYGIINENERNDLINNTIPKHTQHN